MQLWGSFGLRLIDSSYRLKRLILDLYRLLGLLQNIWRLCYYKTDGVSHHPCGVALCDHYIPVLLDVSYLIVRHVRRSQNSEDARQRLRLLFMYFFDQSSRIGRSYSRSVSHRRHFRINDSRDIAVRLALLVQGFACRGIAGCLFSLEFFFVPFGRFHDQIRPVGRNEILRSYIIRILSVSQHLLCYIDTEHVLSNSELRSVLTVAV